MYTSLLLCGATILPLFARIAYAVPVVQSGPVPQALDPPKVSGIYPEPEKCSGVCASIHDPNIVYENDQYWRFTTSRNISIATAPSLEGPWTYQGSLLPNGSKIHLRNDQDIWVRLHNSFTSTSLTSPGPFHLHARRHLVLPLLR
jgi:arabinan endo-1,5-alpha-L-arabinosidase